MDEEVEQGVYAEAGLFMPPHEIQAMWRISFAAYERNIQSLEWRRDHPQCSHLFPDPGTQMTPVKPNPGDIGSIVWRPFPVVAEREDDPDRDNFIRDLVRDIVNNGTGWTGNTLRKMGYAQREVKFLVAEARAMLMNEEDRVDLDQCRALATARLTDLYRLTKDAFDYKTALGSLKELNRVQGLTRDTADTALGELATIAAIITKRDPNRLRLIPTVEVDAEVRQIEEATA